MNFKSPEYAPLFHHLQGNIVKGHGRDHTANIFMEFGSTGDRMASTLQWLAQTFVTSAYEQLVQSEAFNRSGGPGSMFGSLLLSRRAYEKLGFADRLEEWFSDRPDPDPRAPRNAHFLTGMRDAANDLGDRLDPTQPSDQLGRAYLDGTIDALLLLADNDGLRLSREAESVVALLQREHQVRIVAVEHGRALRRNGQGIEHFGYADGRSQPLFLASDFEGLASDGSIDVNSTIERKWGRVDIWNPFAPLSLVLLPDPGANDASACGSYYVVRKLEQNVARFCAAEKDLAKALGIVDEESHRAGAMVVGRFRDGTPLALSDRGGLLPAQANNFRYDQLDANLQPAAGDSHDRLGLKCPFQAHIRKTNPRQSQNALEQTSIAVRRAEDEDRRHSIVRRGITYGRRPDDLEPPESLPTAGVGLLFACYQASILQQFAFIQQMWANTSRFKIPGKHWTTATGLDPLIGQRPDKAERRQHWRPEYGGAPGQPEPEELIDLSLPVSHPVEFEMRDFVKFLGGEFFFAPSLPFLLRR